MKCPAICQLKQLLRLLFILIFLPSVGNLRAQQNFSADSIGKADYARLVPIARGFKLLPKDDSTLQAFVETKYLYAFSREDLKLELELRNNELSCSNCAVREIDFRVDRHTDSSGLMSLTNKFGDVLDLDFRTGVSKSGVMTMYSPDDTIKESANQTYLSISSRFIHYAKVSDKANLALIDFNSNCVPDDGDLVSLSRDNYFFTATGMLSCQIMDSVKVLELDGIRYEFTPPDTRKWEFSLKVLDSTNAREADVALTNHLSDFALGNTTIYQLLDEHPYIILDFFYEYSSQCDEAIPRLNEIDKTIKVVGLLKYGSEFTSYLQLKGYLKNKGINYECFALTEEILQKVNVNGHPWYVLLGPDRKVMGVSRDYKELVQLATGEIK